ncbi:MAG: purine-nucleoside phosphorylase [Christensenellales bacterium]|jgi:purine-nucleoside phosphorylase
MMQRIQKAYEFVAEKVDVRPKVGVILGSGLGHYGETLDNVQSLPYEKIPGFPVSTVFGHDSKFVAGEKAGVPVIMMKGRFHCYEGYSPQEVVIPVRVMKLLGVSALIVTNAAGGIDPSWPSGTIMTISDHINHTAFNPLIGENLEEFGPRFPDMSRCYDEGYIDILHEIGNEQQLPLKKGIYAMMSGPNFETPAEINMLRIVGASAVGMSTVPEVIAARHCGLKVAGLSCITNHAAGICKNHQLTHDEVFETANRVQGQLTLLLDEFFKRVEF